MEKETDTDSPLDSSGSVGKHFTSDGAVGELSIYYLWQRNSAQIYRISQSSARGPSLADLPG